MMNVVIIEDEKPSARRLSRMLSDLDIQVQEMLHSVEDAITWFSSNEHPSLIFLDIQLSDGLSFEIFESVTVKSAIIFTTAYDEYALKAFKLNAIDYLLKPIDQDELTAAVTKFKENRMSISDVTVNIEDIKKLLINPIDRQFKKRFTVKLGQHLKVIPTDTIACVYSEHKATYIHTNENRSYLHDDSLEQVFNDLNTDTFFRVNRTFIIHIDAIQDIIAYSNSRLKLILQNYNEQEIIVSREKVKAFKNWLN